MPISQRYGWGNRAMSHEALGPFVEALASRVAKFPPAGVIAIKRRINDISLPPLADVRTDDRAAARSGAYQGTSR